jgi:Membrane domain of glycerophosphoryl diester phosphodiesterase.
MKFDSNRAWQDAMAFVRANRQVLVPLAGVFFFLPTLLSTVFLNDVQTRMLEAMGKAEIVERIFSENTGLFLTLGIGGLLVQCIGYLAAMALLSDNGRPTVGEAIMAALRGLPTLIGAGLLGMAGMFALSLGLGVVAGGLLGMAIGPVAASGIVVIALIVITFYLAVKLSLVVPVVIIEGVMNPVAAMVRSWRLTQHNSLRIFGFFLLLGIGYVAIAFVTTIVLVGPVALLAGEGKVLTLFTGVVSGAVGAVASVVLTAVLADTHRQLAGPSDVAIEKTFE